MRTGGTPAIRRAIARVAGAVLLLLAGAVPAQDGVGERRIRFHSYATTAGLSQATARAIAQDRDGFLWIGTQDGLDRFDGYGFRVYKHDRDDRDSLIQNHVWALLADADGGLWVGTQGGLQRFDPALEKFVAYPAAAGAESALITALLLDRDGRIWVGSGGGTVQWVDRAAGKLVDTPLGRHASLRMVRALLQARDGTIWIGTYQGLYRCDAAAQQMDEVRVAGWQSLDVYALAETADGSIWVGTSESGLFQLDAAGALRAHYAHDPEGDPAFSLPDDEVRALLPDAGGSLWIGTNTRGLAHLDLAQHRFTRFSHDPSRADTLAANRVPALFAERHGLLVVGTWTNGISIHDPRTRALGLIDRIGASPQPLPVPAQSVHADADGTLWVAIASGGGLVHVDLSGQILRRFVNDPARADSLAHDVVYYVTRTRDGSLWVATIGGGLDRLRADGNGFEHLRHDPADPTSIASNNILFVGDDAAGTLWVATADSGLDERCAGCSGFRHHRHDPTNAGSAAGDTVAALRELRNGEFWVAYRTEGLDRLDRATGRFEHFRSNAQDRHSISTDALSSLAEDHAGDLWIGSQGGGLIHRVAAPGGAVRFGTIDSGDGLAADAIGAIVETGPGTFWVSTTSGLSRVTLAGSAPAIVNFDAGSGAQARGYWVNAAARLPDGRIAFGGLDGISVLDPAGMRPVAATRPLATALLLSNRVVGLRWRDPESPLDAGIAHGGRVVLSYDQDNVSFEFSALDYSNPGAVRYSYQLEGHDNHWIETPASRRIATYTDLPSGHYRLLLRARHEAGDWVDGERPVEVIVRPPPWASPTAYALYAVAAALASLLAGLIARSVLARRHAVQEAIRHSAERLKLALWGSGSELWDVDFRSGRMLRENRLEHLAANSEAREQTMEGYAPFVHPDDVERFAEAMRAHLRGETATFECSYRTLDRNHRWTWILTRGRAQRDAEGRAVRISGTNHDINDLKSAEEALRALNEELESRVEQRTADLREANLKLRGTLDMLTLAQRQLVETEKLASLGGMVAGIAHEINTPLGISVTAASHLQDETRRLSRLVDAGSLSRSALERFEGSVRESADIVLRNLQRADRLVKSFKQVAVDQSSEERRVIDLGKSLDEIITTLGPSLKRANGRITLSCPQLIVFETAPGALYQIISNLVMNSLIHGFDGHGGEIRIDARRDGAAVHIDYRDDGRGMDEEVRRHVFEPFFTTRRGQGGSGLGMHIIYNLVTQTLHGTISCDSAPGAGVHFHIELPAASPPQQKA